MALVSAAAELAVPDTPAPALELEVALQAEPEPEVVPPEPERTPVAVAAAIADHDDHLELEDNKSHLHSVHPNLPLPPTKSPFSNQIEPDVFVVPIQLQHR